ncbi:hypothetical protein AXK11_07795 [Cephaloticoccus primus]|uniref:Antitoxin n=1 Tax=Cephaloticoccus primus TaxID=1548207 RepID=A0A139SJM6_9BACT|nr:type II toxin-antitoxin system VapB family antitoxin [Cephaloticoccus primus]KXU34737.1 hypothetical protein AXK11_07795 [Cephaloticoccus primus]
MKLTVDVDEKLFSRVMDITSAKTEAEAVKMAFEEVVSTDWMKDFFSRPRPPAEELAAAIAPDYTPDDHGWRPQHRDTVTAHP